MTARAAAVALFAASGCAHTPRLPPAALPQMLALPAVGPVAFQPDAVLGKVVLVDFFATWCFPCLADMPNLEDLQRRFGEKGFTVVALGMDLEGALVLEPFARTYALPFPILVASDAIRAGTSSFGRIAELPTTLLLGRQGEVLGGFAGVADHDDMVKAVSRALRR